MKKAIFTLAVLVMAFGNVGLAQKSINLKSIDRANMLKHYGLRERSDMVPQTASWQDDYGDKYRVNYEYDENEFYLNSETYEVFWDGIWQEYEVISYEYDFNGNVLEMLVSDFDGEEWWEMTRATFKYENGLLSEGIIQWFDDGEWVNVEKSAYTYVGDDHWTIIYYDWNGTIWSVNELYTYDKSEGSIELVIQYMQGGAWQNDEQQFFTLDFDEHITSILVQDWQNNAWVNDEQITYDYANGVFDTKIEEEWNGTAWEATRKYTYVYEDGNATLGYCEVNEGDEFVIGDGDIEMAYGYSADSKSFWGYEVNMTYVDLTKVAENAQAVNFKVYPVPTDNEIQIEAEGFQKAEIFTLTGQLLMESEQNSMNVSALASGLYLLKVYDQLGNSATQKFVVK